MRLIWGGVALALALPVTGGTAQQQSAAVKTADGRAVAAAVSARIASDYVVPDLRPKLAAMLDANAKAGRYDGLSAETLARRITEDMAAVAHDKHLGLGYNPEQAALIGTRVRDDDAPNPAWARIAARNNHGVRELRVLDGNIRYMAYDGFMWSGPESAAALENAMRFLAGGDAAIIDIRRNGGGSPEAVAALASYFMDPGIDLVSFQMRGVPSEPSQTTKTAVSLKGKPLYVLASGGSASAAEEFAMHVSAFGFGTLVGSATAGAAYRNELYGLPGGYVLSVSVGRPIHAKTGGDWEGKGVAPAIAVDPGVALERAQAVIYEKLAATEGPDKAQYARLTAFYAAKASPAKPAHALASYAGRYGERTVSVAGDGLAIQRDGGPKSALIALAPDRFALEQDPTTQVRFVTEGDAVRSMEFSRGNGETMVQPKS